MVGWEGSLDGPEPRLLRFFGGPLALVLALALALALAVVLALVLVLVLPPLVLVLVLVVLTANVSNAAAKSDMSTCARRTSLLLKNETVRRLSNVRQERACFRSVRKDACHSLSAR